MKHVLSKFGELKQLFLKLSAQDIFFEKQIRMDLTLL